MQILTTGQCARICKVSTKTIVKWFDSGMITGHRVPGSTDRRIHLISLHELMVKTGMPIPDGMLEGKVPPVKNTPVVTPVPEVRPLAVDLSLEKARALHRVWRALNDGDCPNCHTFHAATDIERTALCIVCPTCSFGIMLSEIKDIEKMFAPAMDSALQIFQTWRKERAKELSDVGYHDV